MAKKRTGRLFVLSAPSGSGKTTLLRHLKKLEPKAVLSLSATTRRARAGERHGRDYLFLTHKRFMDWVRKGEFFEHAKILDRWYGTPRGPVMRALKSGRDVLLGVDIQGARSIRRSGVPVTTIFIVPPSLSELKKRLTKRGTETPAQIAARLKLARREMAEMKRYDYAVVNDRLTDAVHQICAILSAERCRVRKSEAR
jgi:guanylate kinase